MKKIGSRRNIVILEATQDEWEILMRAAGVSSDQKGLIEEINIDPVQKLLSTFWEMRTLRKDLTSLQAKYDKVTTAVDLVLPK